MVCESVKIDGAGTAIVCGPRGRRKKCVGKGCGKPAALLCDWKVAKGTCDAGICKEHGTKVAADKHLCPGHHAAYLIWLDNKKGATDVPG